MESTSFFESMIKVSRRRHTCNIVTVSYLKNTSKMLGSRNWASDYDEMILSKENILQKMIGKSSSDLGKE